MAEPSTNKKLNLRRLLEEIDDEDCIDQEPSTEFRDYVKEVNTEWFSRLKKSNP